MTDKQIKAAFDGNRNLFLTGPAGVGKSYLLDKFIQSHSNVLVCAPTGIAALKIGGETMHKVFHIPIPAFEGPSFAKGKKGAITPAQLRVIAAADTIVIDEVSMARCDNFSYMIKVIRKAEKVKGAKIRIIAYGDFSQLPPVVKKDEEKLMRKFKFDLSGYPFTTTEWKSLNFKVVELTEIKRQSDREFIDHLNEVRVGNFKHIEYFSQFVNENPDTDGAILICGTNATADRLNREYLDEIDGEPALFMADKTGRCPAGIVDDQILIKTNARIIFTANDPEGRFKNGSFGIVKSFDKDAVMIEVLSKDSSYIVKVERREYPVYSYSATGEALTQKQIGLIKQYPFKLGKAITIHKSQGQTFDKVIISPEIFAAGQLYVALSRVTGPDGLSLLSEIKPEYFILDKNVVKFYKNGYKWDAKSRQKKTTAKPVAASKLKTAKSKTKTKPVAKQQKKKTAAAKATVKKAAPKTSKTVTVKSKKTAAAKPKTTSAKKPATRKTTAKPKTATATKKTVKKPTTKPASTRKSRK